MRYAFLATLLCVAACTFGQIQQKGQPYDWAKKSKDLSQTPVISTSTLDRKAIDAYDKEVDQYKETPYRFGIEREVSINLLEQAKLQELDKGDKLWTLGVHCPEATSINFLFSKWNIPEGGELSIWNKDRTEFIGVFTHLNNKKYNSFAVGLIHDDQVYIEYYQPYSVTEQAELTIGTIIHGYRTVVNKWDNAEKGVYGTGGSCNMNVNCPDGADWQSEKRGVALILNGGSAWCTGSLINTTAEDGTEYFLTAAHCDANESNWVFYFNHESAGCSNGTAPTNQSISGATQVASGTASDYHLVELSSNVPSSYNPYYNGWDRSGAAVPTAVGIHHPSGDIKKISFDDDPLTNTTYLSNNSSSTGNHWRVESWERSTTTEGGSSGSPLFDQNHRIIGQLHGGYAACGNTDSDWYGALKSSWSGLSSYLDPLGTGTMTVDGYDPSGAPQPTCNDGIQNGTETGVDCGGSCPSCACNGTSVTVSITFDNYPEETSWSITQSGSTIASGGTYGSQADGSTVNIPVCLSNGCFDFTINDVYGDGICCSYGNGSYSVTDGGTVLVSGASFTSSETTNFCVGSEPTPTCDDGIQNQGETGVDCGGPCTACASCNDGIQNQGETGVDCGGPCAACPTCNDGIQNQGETGVDCGGPCTACATCNDGIQNQGESGVDCGGPCAACATCNDGIQNQGETGVDCGGPCAPCNTGCSGTEATLSITFDNYPEETSWSITQGGATIESGGTYGSQADGSSISLDVCLPDGCYTFTINDVYGDGICCSYGNGSYSLSNGGTVYASGGSFSSSESTDFCTGLGPAATCSDGIQNQGETGVDCGGPCAPCNTGGCTETAVNSSNFDSGWGIWNDGGSDCSRSSAAAYAHSGSYTARLRDNTSSSVVTTDNLNLTSFEDISVDFYFYPRGMENGEDFWLQYSTNGGSSYTTVASYASGTDFTNDSFYSSSVDIDGPFTSNTRFRFRCDASSNSDYIYIDDVTIAGCSNGNMIQISEDQVTSGSEMDLISGDVLSDIILYPNPTESDLNVQFSLNSEEMISMSIVDIQGRIIRTKKLVGVEGKNTHVLTTNDLEKGTYMILINANSVSMTERFVVLK